MAMNLATIQHHSFMKSAVVDVGVQVGSPLRFDWDLSSAEKSDGASDETSSVIEYMSPAPAVTVAPPDPVIEYVVLTPTVLVVENVTPVLVPDFVTPPAHVIQYAAPLKHLWFDEFAILQWFGEPAIFYICCGGLCLTSRWSFSCRERVRFARIGASLSGTDPCGSMEF